MGLLGSSVSGIADPGSLWGARLSCPCILDCEARLPGMKLVFLGRTAISSSLSRGQCLVPSFDSSYSPCLTALVQIPFCLLTATDVPRVGRIEPAGVLQIHVVQMLRDICLSCNMFATNNCVESGFLEDGLASAYPGACCQDARRGRLGFGLDLRGYCLPQAREHRLEGFLPTTLCCHEAVAGCCGKATGKNNGIIVSEALPLRSVDRGLVLPRLRSYEIFSFATASWRLRHLCTGSRAISPFPLFPRGLGCGLVLFSPCKNQYQLCPGCQHIPGPHMVAKNKNSPYQPVVSALELSRLCHAINFQGFSPYRAVRVGEAFQPGPRMHSEFTFAVINPTAVLNKASVVAEVGAHVVLASETSATSLTQKVMRFPFQQQGFSCSWGSPVPEQMSTKSGTCKRGQSIGTAVFSKLPRRGTLQPFQPEQVASCRIHECFVRAGPLEIKVIVVYGWPVSTPESAARNNLLLAWAYERATSNRVPAIIGGDFNAQPQNLPVWQSFAQQGWVEVGQFVQHAFHQDLPPTCKGATRNDTFLLPPVLQQFFVGADVLTEAMLFDAHAPMRIRLRLPGEISPSMHWRLPRALADFQIQSHDLEQHYQAYRFETALQHVPADYGCTALRTWSSAIEESASKVLLKRSKDEPHLKWPAKLPRSYSGRCCQRQRVARTLPQLPRQARSGQPQPQCETTSVRSRQKLWQRRRLHVLQQGLRKLPSLPQGPHYTAVLRSLLQQWQAVKGAAGYAEGFVSWVLGWPEFTFCPLELPDVEFVSQLMQIVRFDYESLAFQESKIKKDLFRYQVTVGAKGRSASPSFVRIKPPPPETIRMVFKKVEGLATEISSSDWGRRTYNFAAAGSLLLHQPVYVAGTCAQIYKVTDGQVRIVFASDDDIVLPRQVYLWQEQADCTPQGISSALTDFWSEFWCRDSRTEEWDLEAWPQFRDLLQGHSSPCSHISVNMRDVSAWVHAVRRLPRKKATGVCGWHNTDLRVLPEAAIADLAAILNSPQLQGFPAELMQARVAVLGKTVNPTSPAQSRPITVLSNLYRLWARVLCQQIIYRWSYSLPPCIRGCLKGRCAQDISYWLQQIAETNTLENVPTSGLVLDLRKAFNLLPRAPIGELMRVLGIPAPMVSFWLGSLKNLHRSFQVHDHLGPPLHSTTGIPEGDPLSVLDVCLLQPCVAPTAYVDNLAWSTDLQECHGPALDQLQSLVNATKMQIDWGKTYFWATHAAQRAWWKKGSSHLLPPGISVPVFHQVRELGSHLNFCKRRGLGHLIDNFDQAVERLHKLYHDPSPLTVKAHVVQAGVWPFAFYGALTVAPGRQRQHKLRSNAARAIVGRHHTLSPMAAMYFVPGVSDPETYLMSYQACHLARTARLMPEVAGAVLKIASRPGFPLTVHGPGTALQQMFGRTGWTIKVDGKFAGPGNVSFNVYTSSPTEIKLAIQLSWALEVQEALQGRSGLQHFPLPSRAITQKLFQHFQPWEQTILARHITGAFLSNAEKAT